MKNYFQHPPDYSWLLLTHIFHKPFGLRSRSQNSLFQTMFFSSACFSFLSLFKLNSNIRISQQILYIPRQISPFSTIFKKISYCRYTLRPMACQEILLVIHQFQTNSSQIMYILSYSAASPIILTDILNLSLDFIRRVIRTR